MKKLSSAGELVRICNTHEIGMDLLVEICLRKAEAEKEEELKRMKKQLQQRYDVLKLYAIMKGKKKIDNWVNVDYKVAIKAMKIESDGQSVTLY